MAAVCDACCANLINVEEADGDNDGDYIPNVNESRGADNDNNDGDSGDHAPVVDVIVSFDGTWHKRDLHQTMV